MHDTIRFLSETNSLIPLPADTSTSACTREPGFNDDNIRVAAVDLGSNSFHLLVARVTQGELRPMEAHGERVQLAADMRNGRLDNNAMARSLECLTRFRQILTAREPDIVRVVGTNALRAAKNASEFTDKAFGVLGYPVEVISGREEARLVYLGVAHTLADDDRSRLVVDIGGGSTEFIIGRRFRARLTESLHMGCVSWRDKYFANGRIRKKSFNRAYQAAYLETLNIRSAYRRVGWDNAVGSSGTLNAIAEVLSAQHDHRQEITRAGLDALKKELLSFSCVDDLAALPGLKEHRRNVFPSGVAICCALFDALEIESMQTSGGALREGVAYELLGRLSHEDVRERTVSALMTRYDSDADNAARVEETANHLFCQVQDSWRLSEVDGELLRWAARLHEVGLSIAHSQFHKHGQYLIDNSDLPGFSIIEQKILGLLVRSHRRKFPVEQFALLHGEEKLRLQRLAALLRLAVVFKYVVPVDGMPVIRFQVQDNQCKLEFPDKWLVRHPLTKAELEIEKSYLRAAGFELSY